MGPKKRTYSHPPLPSIDRPEKVRTPLPPTSLAALLLSLVSHMMLLLWLLSAGLVYNQLQGLHARKTTKLYTHVVRNTRT
jgi:hypothetical protein